MPRKIFSPLPYNLVGRGAEPNFSRSSSLPRQLHGCPWPHCSIGPEVSVGTIFWTGLSACVVKGGSWPSLEKAAAKAFNAARDLLASATRAVGSCGCSRRPLVPRLRVPWLKTTSGLFRGLGTPSVPPCCELAQSQAQPMGHLHGICTAPQRFHGCGPSSPRLVVLVFARFREMSAPAV